MTPIFVPLDPALVARWRAGGVDANGKPSLRAVSDGAGVPCRVTLALVPAGHPYLILAHRPFAGLTPWAETGPIFVAAAGEPAEPSPRLPAFLTSPQYLLRGYDAGERIVYGTGTLTPTARIPQVAADLLARPEVAFVHLRSATNGCFHVRIERG
jgi:hypothetical protein